MDALGPLPALWPVRRTPSSDASPDERHPPGALPEPPPRRNLPQQALLDALASRDASATAPTSPPPTEPLRPALPTTLLLLQARPDALPLRYGRPAQPQPAAPHNRPETTESASRLVRLMARLEQVFGRESSALHRVRQTLARAAEPAHQSLTWARQLTEAGHPGEALDLLDHLDPAPAPRPAGWFLARAAAWQALQRPQEAAREATAALAQAGADPALRHEALHRLGQALTQRGEPAEAAWCYRTLVDENPQDAGAALAAASASAAEADWPALEQDQVRLERALQQPAAPHPEARTVPDPALLAAFTDDPARLRQAAEQALRARLGRGIARRAAQKRARRAPAARLRLGVLIGAPLAGEAPPWPIVAMLAELDPAQFELFAYLDRPEDDEHALQHLRTQTCHWRDCIEQDADALEATISADGLDLLAVLDARPDTRRLSTLARHPAALQIAWADGPGSTGADFIDYLVGDPERTPLDLRDAMTEAIAQMPRRHRPTAEPPAPPDTPFDPPTRADCGLPETAMVYACFARPGAILPEQFAVWCRILADTDGAVLWLRGPSPAVRTRLQEAAAGLGIAAHRLVFASEQEAARHVARLPLADLVLDTFPDSGERRCVDALQQGVPVLTRRGRCAGSRRAAALLQSLGLPELVCDGPERLHIEAVRLGRDPARRAALREQLQQRLQADPLHAPAGLARDFAALVRRMIDRLEAGRPPIALAALPPPSSS
ncbi:MAG: hypothetical protein QG612_117 [Pseudomonadota bacterium]|nr:hypothetical protein [Pseudomonadota bacterium]